MPPTSLHDIPQRALRDLVAESHGRAVEALADLTQRRLALGESVITIEVHGEIDMRLSHWIRGKVVVVNQEFSGPIAGNAWFLLDTAGAKLVTGRLSEEAGPGLSDREIIAEVGNIFLNACLGVFGNELRIKLEYRVPETELKARPAVLPGPSEPDPIVKHVLVVRTPFHTAGQPHEEGQFVLVLGLAPLDHLRTYLEGRERGG